MIKVQDPFYPAKGAALHAPETRRCYHRLKVQPLTSQIKTRLLVATLCYAGLAAMAGLTLSDWRIRAAVWILLAGLGVKTWIAAMRRDE
ncbi:MAG: hypothetical protein ACM3S5_01910 [Rhodospirillales bacterium]